MTESAELTIRGCLSSLLPRLAHPASDSMPPWPPDVFALGMTLLRRCGAYCEVLNHWPPRRMVGERGDWARNIREWAREWRVAYSRGAPPPSALTRRWAAFREAMDEPLSCLGNSRLEACQRLLELCAAADESCRDVGVERSHSGEPRSGDDARFLLQAARLLTNVRIGSSLCQEIERARIRVLPRIHTPGSGLTIRSLSLYLALCPPEEMTPKFIRASASEAYDAMNLLVVPWPFQMVPAQFRPAKRLKEEMRNLPDSVGFFTVEERGQSRPVTEVVERLCLAAEQEIGPVAGVVLPEAAINPADLESLSENLNRQGRFLIAGVGTPTRPSPRPSAPYSLEHGTNSACIALPGYQIHFQDKHHRWKLDRSQIEQYALGGILHPDKSWWEHIRLGDRTLLFLSPQRNLTMSVLICEDLARPDPVGDLVRAVGPDLVVALLMDGPQLGARWPGRYAMSLADDPGSSVLSVTSYGMSKLSRPIHGSGADRSGVVALWKDRFSGAPVEIGLPEGYGGIVLSIALRKLVEHSADSREKTTTCPVLAGIRHLKMPAQ